MSPERVARVALPHAVATVTVYDGEGRRRVASVAGEVLGARGRGAGGHIEPPVAVVVVVALEERDEARFRDVGARERDRGRLAGDGLPAVVVVHVRHQECIGRLVDDLRARVAMPAHVVFVEREAADVAVAQQLSVGIGSQRRLLALVQRHAQVEEARLEVVQGAQRRLERVARRQRRRQRARRPDRDENELPHFRRLSGLRARSCGGQAVSRGGGGG